MEQKAGVFQRLFSYFAAAGLLVSAASGCQMAATGQNMQGVRLYQQGQHQLALQRFQQAITQDPVNADGYYNLAATYHKMGIQSNDKQLLDQAETIYNHCLDFNENHTDCRRGLAVLLIETKRSDLAFKQLKNWAIAEPSSADARVELARLYQEFGDKETAKLQLAQALQIDQNNSRAWAALGHMREESGQYGQALANYQRSYNLNGMQPAIAQRIAALNSTVSGGSNSLSAGGTRMVNSNRMRTKY